MKHILFITAILLGSFNLMAQVTCTAPMPDVAFKKSLSELSQTTNEMQMQNKTKMLLRNNCFSSAQVKEIALLFFDDYSKLEFAKAAYPKTVDPVNYYDVYDAFAYFSTVFRLHDFVLGQNVEMPDIVVELPRPIKPQFPAYNYPDALRYTGATSCNSPTSDMEFEKVAQNVMQQTSDPARVTIGTQLAQKYCFTVAQVMKLTSLIGEEKDRLKFLFDVYAYTYDVDNFGACEQTLAPGFGRNELARFLADRMQLPEPPPPPPCDVSVAELEQIKESIKSQNFNNTQVTLAKQALSSKPCFEALQIRDIVGLFSFESSKLEIAKYAYDYCEDKNNYFLVNDAFSFSSSVDDLNKHIQSKK